jgi:hypothetical protein
MTVPRIHTPEHARLEDDATRAANWKRWGPYLSERQWGTVREDYSANGDCWNYLTHDQARSRAYRWGEDGLFGICDRECRLCFSLAFWNGQDDILKERLFGLTGPEGNHGEDVKECYFYLDSTPTHSYLKGLYKYPQGAFPYDQLVAENRNRGRDQPEFEILDTGIFDDNRYFDIFAEYAKAGPDDLLIRITICNRGPDEAVLHALPTLWYRNSWSWGCLHEGCERKPWMKEAGDNRVRMNHVTLGDFTFAANASSTGIAPQLLFTENETNFERLYGAPEDASPVKDAFHDYLIHNEKLVVANDGRGTKVAAYYNLVVPAGGEITLELRLFEDKTVSPGTAASPFGEDFSDVFAKRKEEADAFYNSILPPEMTAEQHTVARQAYAGLLWSKQFYHYIVEDWLNGDPEQPPPPEERKQGRNHDWPHLYNRDIISMPDKWEYPWYAAWDLAFHMLPMADVDPCFAREQLKLFLREWYMHPNGEIPAYEFNFGDVNPPVHAWACWRVYKMCGRRDERDRLFLARTFQKLLLNFTWWVNRKDVRGEHLFSGGFLGLDNIGVFDRSKPLPTGGVMEQADGTAWMAFFCSTMLSMALELAKYDAAYEDIASKFLEHFVHIADAINCVGGAGLWDEEDGFYYDMLRCNGRTEPMRIRSMVGIIPLFAAEVYTREELAQLPEFSKRAMWFVKHRRDLARQITYMESSTEGDSGSKLQHWLLAIPSRERLTRALKYILDENEFLSPYGIRALSKYHESHPFVFNAGGQQTRVAYVPAESDTGMFGGNSNWRGPIWFPVNYLLIEALERYHHFYGDTLKVEFPTGSGNLLNLQEVAHELAHRLTLLFLPDANGRRPCHGTDERFTNDPHWQPYPLFYEYFHGDNGRGAGANHQTGWTSLVARLMADVAGRNGKK